MYLSLVTMLEHAMLTFISRMKSRVSEVCQGKVAFLLLEDKRGNPTPLSQQMERRNLFTFLQRLYSDEDDVDAPTTNKQEHSTTSPTTHRSAMCLHPRRGSLPIQP